MKPRSHTSSLLPWLLLTVPILYLAALLASGYEDGMTVFDLMGRFSELLERPFAIRWTPHTPKFLLGGLVLYAFAAVLFQSTRQNRRPGEEHGSAKWGDPRQLDRKYRDIIVWQMMCFRQLAGCFHTIWHTNAAKPLEYALKPEHTGISRPERKALSFLTKFEAAGMQRRLCRSLCLI